MILAEGTRGLIGAAKLALMKPTAYLINISRGPVVQENVLIAALTAKKIAGEGLDVFDAEPLPKDHPFRTLDNVMITLYTGYITDEHYKVFFGEAVENVAAFVRAEPIRVLTENNMIAALKAKS